MAMAVEVWTELLPRAKTSNYKWVLCVFCVFCASHLGQSLEGARDAVTDAQSNTALCNRNG